MGISRFLLEGKNIKEKISSQEEFILLPLQILCLLVFHAIFIRVTKKDVNGFIGVNFESVSFVTL